MKIKSRFFNAFFALAFLATISFACNNSQSNSSESMDGHEAVMEEGHDMEDQEMATDTLPSVDETAIERPGTVTNTYN
jgi:hypothetical protein